MEKIIRDEQDLIHKLHQEEIEGATPHVIRHINRVAVLTGKTFIPTDTACDAF